MNKKYMTRTEESKDDWETPQEFFNILDKEFSFTLDACASKENTKCKKFYTKEQNGLIQNWKGETVFCNPPYVDIEIWCKKCSIEGNKPNTVVVLLMPVRSDTKYWHNYIMKAEEIRFVKGRIHFLLNGVAQKQTNFPSCVIVFRKTKTDLLRVLAPYARSIFQ